MSKQNLFENDVRGGRIDIAAHTARELRGTREAQLHNRRVLGKSLLKARKTKKSLF